MAAISSVFWILGFILSVVIAPQLRVWTWGPTMLCFGLATAAALPVLWRRNAVRESLFILIPGIATVAWIVIRAATSPVAELAMQDLLLVSMAVSTFIVFLASGGEGFAGKVLIGGIALMLGASVWVIWRQIADPSYSPVFPPSEIPGIRGFFGHYSYCASFLIPCSLLLASLAIHTRYHAVIRGLLLLLAALGAIAVFYTNSRGGFVGIGAGAAALVFGTILVGKREGKRWFVPAAILSPILFLGLGTLFLILLKDVQQSRMAGTDLDDLLDNSIRFYLLGIAASCIAAHPWLGGGSRSFSWESFRFWDVSAYGPGGTRPEHVHNELIQTFSEYGILGGAILVVFLACVAVSAIIRTLSKDKGAVAPQLDGWRVGGLAGLVGLFAQSNFEGIFRIPPGAILLALCLAAAAIGRPGTQTARMPGLIMRNGLLTVCALGSIALLVTFGWKGTKASASLWPAHFAAMPMGTEQRIDALSEGIRVWPMASLLQQRGIGYRRLADEQSSEQTQTELLSLALEDFTRAADLHPLDPTHQLNTAGTLGMLGRDAEAEAFFRKAIVTQGNMEAAFNANHRYARFLLGRGIREYNAEDFLSAISTLQIAAKHLKKAFDLNRGNSLGAEGHSLNVEINVALGQTLEAVGDFKGALAQYDHVVTLRNGTSGHYLAGLMLGKRAVAAWSERRSEDALRLFIEADKRIPTTRALPAGVTAEDREEYIKYLRNTIQYLKGAKVEPSDNPQF